MRRQVASLWSSSSPFFRSKRDGGGAIDTLGRRGVKIYATPSSSAPAATEVAVGSEDAGRTPDAKFEVVGAPFSMLSVQLSPSQNLYTRRGTLVAVSGKAENAISTLSPLSPLTRAPVGIPFLYQCISSSTPISALISSKSPLTSFTTIHLDGRLDWMVTQRNALLAWTGHNLVVKPRINTRMAFQNWGNTFLSGRGLVALVGKGQIYQISLKDGEEYVVHPGNVVAYTQNGIPPQPYRFRSSVLRLQVPSLGSLLPDTRFFNEMKKSGLWNFLAEALYKTRTWTRRNIWGDRLFLQFKGPTTILLQSRGSRITDSLSSREINEIADTPAGVARQVTTGDLPRTSSSASASSKSESVSEREKMRQEGTDGAPASMQEAFTTQGQSQKPASVSWATVSRGGKVDFKEGEKVA